MTSEPAGPATQTSPWQARVSAEVRRALSNMKKYATHVFFRLSTRAAAAGIREVIDVMSVPLYQAKAEFFKTLGHPARIRILELADAISRSPSY